MTKVQFLRLWTRTKLYTARDAMLSTSLPSRRWLRLRPSHESFDKFLEGVRTDLQEHRRHANLIPERWIPDDQHGKQSSFLVISRYDGQLHGAHSMLLLLCRRQDARESIAGGGSRSNGSSPLAKALSITLHDLLRGHEQRKCRGAPYPLYRRAPPCTNQGAGWIHLVEPSTNCHEDLMEKGMRSLELQATRRCSRPHEWY